MSQPATATAEPMFDPGPPVLPALWAARWSILLSAVIAGLLGFGLSALQPSSYQATAELLLADPRNSGVFEDTGVNFLDPSRYVRNPAELARSGPVMAEASALVGGRFTPEQVADRVDVRPSVDLDLLTITASDGTGAGAADLANAVAEAYQTVVRQQVADRTEASLTELRGQRVQLEETIAAAEEAVAADPGDTAAAAQRDAAVDQLVSINNRIDQIAVDASLFGAGVDLVEEAEIPGAPAAPQPYRNAVLATVLGALAAAGWAWWRADETATVDGRNDPAEVLRAPLLGVVPSYEETRTDTALPTVASPTSGISEAYQFLVSAIAHQLEEIDGRAILITSAGPTDGKTLTAANLAIAAAQDGREVLLLDADTRVRGLTRLFEVEPRGGLADLVQGDTLEDVITIMHLEDRKAVPMIPAVPLGDDTAAFFRTPEFRRVAADLSEAADLVIYDTPPMLLASDTAAIASSCDGIVLVVARGTSIQHLTQLRERLDRIGTPVLGYVFTKARADRSYGYDYYGYGYRHLDFTEEEQARASRATAGGAAREEAPGRNRNARA